MKVLVTGGGGFLGRYLVERLLLRGDEVRVFGRGEYPDLKRCGAEVFRGDLRDNQAVREACCNVELVYHTAAIAGIQCQWKPYYEINVEGTKSVLQGCFEHGVSRLVYTGSPSAVFAGEPQEGIDESAPYPEKWLAHYPKSKAIAEMSVLEANGRELPGRKGERFLSCSLRPHLIWGPRDNHLIPRLLQRARAGRIMMIGDGRNLIDNIYVENAAAAHIQAAEALLPDDSPVAGKAYFLSQGEPVNCWDWINEILGFVDLEPIKSQISYATAYRIGWAVETAYALLGIKSEPPMSRFLAAQLAMSHYFDISAAQRDFGYEPEIPTAEGMERLREYLLSQEN